MLYPENAIINSTSQLRSGQFVQKGEFFASVQYLNECGKFVTEKKSIYLDYQASTPLAHKALEAMIQAEEYSFANPHSSEHVLGWKAAAIIDDAAKEVADFIGALESEIIFVSGATEANSLAIIGVGLAARKRSSRKKIVVSAIEHKCVLGSALFLAENFGYEVVKANVKSDGRIDVEHLEKLIDSDTLLVSIMAVNNEIGTYQPIHEISKICRESGAIFHVDAAQALYKKIDVVEDGIDLLSLSSHKMYGPKGIGALFINQFIEIKPSALFQGGEQQQGYRSGTIPTSLVAGFAAAIKELKENRDNEEKILLSHRNYAWERLQNSISHCEINGSLENRHPGNLNITFLGIDAKWLIGNIQPDIAISTGSACTSGIPEPSHVLRAIGQDTEESESAVRISFGRYTTQEEIEYAINKIIDATNAYRSEFGGKFNYNFCDQYLNKTIFTSLEVNCDPN